MMKQTLPLSQLARIRRNLGLSQADLASRAGVSAQLISLLERGLPPVDPHHVTRLAAVLGVDPAALTSAQLTITTSPSGVVTVKVSA